MNTEYWQRLGPRPGASPFPHHQPSFHVPAMQMYETRKLRHSALFNQRKYRFRSQLLAVASISTVQVRAKAQTNLD